MKVMNRRMIDNKSVMADFPEMSRIAEELEKLARELHASFFHELRGIIERRKEKGEEGKNDFYEIDLGILYTIMRNIKNNSSAMSSLMEKLMDDKVLFGSIDVKFYPVDDKNKNQQEGRFIIDQETEA